MRITILALCARSSSSSYVDIGTYMILESSKLIFNWTAYFSLILLLLSLRVRHRHVDIVTVQFYANFLISFLRKLLSLSLPFMKFTMKIKQCVNGSNYLALQLLLLRW